MRYLIDGYNVIFQLIESEETPLSVRRDQIFPLFSRLFYKKKEEVLIIFDSKLEFGTLGKIPKESPFSVAFSPYPLSGDEYILELISFDKKKKDLLLVTSDRLLSKKAQEFGVATLSVLEFFKKRSREPFSEEKPISSRRDEFYKKKFAEKLEISKSKESS